MARKLQVPGEGDTEQAAPDAKRSDIAPPDLPMVADSEWRDRTWQEAMAAGVTKSVLCKNGWYVPATANTTRLAVRHVQER
jgi:hypothetical protein